MHTTLCRSSDGAGLRSTRRQRRDGANRAIHVVGHRHVGQRQVAGIGHRKGEGHGGGYIRYDDNDSRRIIGILAVDVFFQVDGRQGLVEACVVGQIVLTGHKCLCRGL